MPMEDKKIRAYFEPAPLSIFACICVGAGAYNPASPSSPLNPKSLSPQTRDAAYKARLRLLRQRKRAMDKAVTPLIDVYRTEQKIAAAATGEAIADSGRRMKLQLAQPKGRGGGEIRIGLAP